MIHQISADVLLSASYAAFLALVAAALEAIGRQSHRRSEQFQVAGFRFLQDLDRWECPTGQQLSRSETESFGRIVRYRAPSHVCNSCPAKPACTDSDNGREIQHRVDSWLTSEIRHFHRGVSLALLLLAVLILVVQLFHHHKGNEFMVLCFLLGSVGAIGWHLLTTFLRHHCSPNL